MNEVWLRKAIRLAERTARKNLGGPFGAFVVKDGKVVGPGWNKVTISNDPTAHAEVVAIRAACRRLKSFRLDGCILYSSCEPCPMCLAAAYWAHLSEVYYGACRRDAAQAGFDDALLYEEIAKPATDRQLKMTQILAEEALVPFKIWAENPARMLY